MLNVLLIIIGGIASLVLFLMGAAFALASGRFEVIVGYAATLAIAGVVAVLVFVRLSSRSTVATSWLVRIRRAMVTATVISALGLVTAMGGNALVIRPPKQAALVTQLRAHQSEYERLREMLTADKLLTIADYGASYSRTDYLFEPSSRLGISEARVDEYKKLMRAADVRRIDVQSTGPIVFSFSYWGTANRGWRVNLAWSTEEPAPLMPTIDGFPGTKPPGAPNYAFSRLEGDWYAHMVW